MILVCYDIADPRRLARIARLCSSWGVRLQRSFFLAEVSLETFEKNIKAAIERILNPEEDSVLVYPLSPRELERASYLGGQEKPGTEEVIVF